MRRLFLAPYLLLMLTTMVSTEHFSFAAAQESSPAISAGQGVPPGHALTDAQKKSLAEISAAADEKAKPVALHLAAVVKQIYENMLADKPNEKLRLELSDQMKAIAGELLTIKGQSIHDAVGCLDHEQKQTLREELAKPDAPSDLTELIQRLR